MQEEQQVKRTRETRAIALALLLATGIVLLLQALAPEHPAPRHVPRSLAQAAAPASAPAPAASGAAVA